MSSGALPASAAIVLKLDAHQSPSRHAIDGQGASPRISDFHPMTPAADAHITNQSRTISTVLLMRATTYGWWAGRRGGGSLSDGQRHARRTPQHVRYHMPADAGPISTSSLRLASLEVLRGS